MAIIAPPALVAFGWATVYVPFFRLVIAFGLMAILSYVIYHFILFLIEHRNKDNTDKWK